MGSPRAMSTPIVVYKCHLPWGSGRVQAPDRKYEMSLKYLIGTESKETKYQKLLSCDKRTHRSKADEAPSGQRGRQVLLQYQNDITMAINGNMLNNTRVHND